MDMELAVVQLIAYVTLTLGSVIVAIVSLTFAYRQNFGWRPLALVPSHGLSGGMVEGHYGATLQFEVWNRRKYPVAIRYCDVAFSVLTFESASGSGDGPEPEWGVWERGKLHSREELVLGPNEHKEYNVEGLFKKRSLDDLVDPVTIEVSYFDPRRNKTYEIIVKYTYRLSALDKKM